jgi:hypothetical protein
LASQLAEEVGFDFVLKGRGFKRAVPGRYNRGL